MGKNQRKAWRKLLVLCVRFNANELSNKEFIELLTPRMEAYQKRYHSDLESA